jgi:hypothetical protein
MVAVAAAAAAAAALTAAAGQPERQVLRFLLLLQLTPLLWQLPTPSLLLLLLLLHTLPRVPLLLLLLLLVLLLPVTLILQPCHSATASHLHIRMSNVKPRIYNTYQHTLVICPVWQLTAVCCCLNLRKAIRRILWKQSAVARGQREVFACAIIKVAGLLRCAAAACCC